MGKTKGVALFILSSIILGLSGCYYRQTALLHPPHEGQDLSQKDISIRIKPLRDFECTHYFDSRLVTKGVQPIQVYIQNDSKKVLVLDATKLSAPLLGKHGIGAKMYKNIVARTIVWALGVSVLWWAFAPLLILDPLFCIQANQEAHKDIESICVQPKDQIVIRPQSRLHKILFIPSEKYHQHLSITLREQDSENELIFTF